MDDAEAQIYLGERFAGRYLIRAFIGKGAFAGVFEAEDEQECKSVAVKILSIQAARSPAAQIEFDVERELLSRLSRSSNVVELIDSGRQMMTVSVRGIDLDIEVPFLVLELAIGSLSLLLLDRHRLAWGDRLDLFREVAKGVHQMHKRRIVHRDPKADNAVLFPRHPRAKVSDLGRSCDVDASRRFPMEDYVAGRGDLRFAPPELVFCCGAPNPLEMAQADLYLLGSLLFEIGTGVGLTSAVFGDPRHECARLAQMSEAARKVEFVGRHGELRERYALAYEIFRAEAPSHIRNPACDLLRLLTDPDPNRRTPPMRKRHSDPWDLGWLLTRIDVLRKLDAYNTRLELKRRQKLARKAARR